MPINFDTERFNPAIDETINNIYAAICGQSRGTLIENLRKFEIMLPGYFHLQIPPTINPQQRAQEVYRELLQHLICYTCRTIKDGDPESLCLLLVNICSDLFHINNETGQRIPNVIVWSDPEGTYTA